MPRGRPKSRERSKSTSKSRSKSQGKNRNKDRSQSRKGNRRSQSAEAQLQEERKKAKAEEERKKTLRKNVSAKTLRKLYDTREKDFLKQQEDREKQFLKQQEDALEKMKNEMQQKYEEMHQKQNDTREKDLQQKYEELRQKHKAEFEKEKEQALKDLAERLCPDTTQWPAPSSTPSTRKENRERDEKAKRAEIQNLTENTWKTPKSNYKHPTGGGKTNSSPKTSTSSSPQITKITNNRFNALESDPYILSDSEGESWTPIRTGRGKGKRSRERSTSRNEKLREKARSMSRNEKKRERSRERSRDKDKRRSTGSSRNGKQSIKREEDANSNDVNDANFSPLSRIAKIIPGSDLTKILKLARQKNYSFERILSAFDERIKCPSLLSQFLTIREEAKPDGENTNYARWYRKILQLWTERVENAEVNRESLANLRQSGKNLQKWVQDFEEKARKLENLGENEALRIMRDLADRNFKDVLLRNNPTKWSEVPKSITETLRITADKKKNEPEHANYNQHQPPKGNTKGNYQKGHKKGYQNHKGPYEKGNQKGQQKGKGGQGKGYGGKGGNNWNNNGQNWNNNGQNWNNSSQNWNNSNNWNNNWNNSDQNYGHSWHTSPIPTTNYSSNYAVEHQPSNHMLNYQNTTTTQATIPGPAQLTLYPPSFVMNLGSPNSTKTTWIVDSGASSHTTGDISLLQNVISDNKRFETCGEPVFVQNRGTVSSAEASIKDVYHIPGAKVNLLSLAKLIDAGCVADFTKCALYLNNGLTLPMQKLHNIYTVNITTRP